MGQAGNFDTPANEARGTGTAWSAQITVDSEHANVKGAPELGAGLPFQRGISEPTTERGLVTRPTGRVSRTGCRLDPTHPAMQEARVVSEARLRRSRSRRWSG